LHLSDNFGKPAPSQVLDRKREIKIQSIKPLARIADARIFNHRWTQINTDGFDMIDRLLQEVY